MSAFLMLSLSACSSEDPAAPAEPALKKWSFRFSTEAIAVRSATEYELSRSVGMSAYVFDDGSQPGLPEYMWNEEVVRKGAGWDTADGYARPAAGKSILFQAYYPYFPQDGTGPVNLAAATIPGPLSLEYEVPSDVSDQIDLMTGESETLSTDEDLKDVLVSMSHRLSAIQFVTGDIGLAGTVRSISLKNIHKKGTYSLGDDSWTLESATDGVFSVYPDYVVEGVTMAGDPDGRQMIAGGDNTFMMLPQAIPDDAKMVIEYEATVDGVKSVHTLEAKLKSRNIPEWQWGKVYTYQISVVSLALEYEVFVHEWEFGGQADVNIKI